MKRHRGLVALATIACLAACSGGGSKATPSTSPTPTTAPPTTAAPTTAAPPAAQPSEFSYVPGSTTKVCTLTGGPTAAAALATAPARRFGLMSADLGYSFTYGGHVWFIFGDAMPTRDFPEGSGRPNAATRYPRLATGLDNDAIAYADPTPPGVCPTLQFIPQTTAPVGAFTSPSVVLDGEPVSLRTNESPESGLTVNGRMYVVFDTGNRCDLPAPPPSFGCTGAAGGYGHPTESVIGELADQSTLQFTGLYTLSSPSSPFGSDAKFVMVALQAGAGGYIYLWGTAGGDNVRHSPPYLARVPAADIGSRSAITYFEGSSSAGTPMWGDQESSAVPLFHNSPDCMGELGVEYNRFLASWMMLYNCLDNTPQHPRGIWMRTAPRPWGPWSLPQTIFRANGDGYCVVVSEPSCPPPYNGGLGGEYGPYFIAGWTTGHAATAGAPASTTIYYTVDTFVPYGQVIERSTITGAPS